MNKIIILLIIVITILSCFFTYKKKNNEIIEEKNKLDTNLLLEKVEKNNSNIEEANVKEMIEVIVVDDKRCKDCNTLAMIKELQGLNKDIVYNTIDFEEDKAKNILEKESFEKTIPFFLFPINEIETNKIKKFLYPTKSKDKFFLHVGATFNPYGEICGNNIDDNNDGKIDCEDKEVCGQDINCKRKIVKPQADLFIMSYCPYGLQAQKGFIEAMDLLKNHADINIKFVHYLMHGKKEGEENIRQYCIQKEDKDKYIEYSKCFLENDTSKECLVYSKIDTKKLETCIIDTKKEFNFDKGMINGGQFPEFNLNKEESIKYGVTGSPTFILNGEKINIGRDAKSYVDMICSTFLDKPSICNEEVNDILYDPGFGYTKNGESINGGCGIN